jgi:KAP family P-loop domain
LLNDISRRFEGLIPRALTFLRAVLAGTALGFMASICRPLIRPARELLNPYLLPLPSHTFTQALVALLLLFLMALFSKLPRKLLRSLKLGLIPFPELIWVLSAAVFWVAYDSHRTLLAFASVAFAALLTTAGTLAARSSQTLDSKRPALVESDLPVPEGGKDLLGRREIVEGLVSMILLDQPSIIAVTGAYGDGKTSLLNLTVGEIRKLEGDDLPVIVRFSPWLAGDSNSLVLSLLNSIVVEIKGRFIVPGLGRDAARYARALLGAIPKIERLRDFIGEPSQEQHITALTDHISKTRRRVVVVMDDLDRMQAEELETVLKLLRGSDRLSNITFVCSFDKTEVALILRAARPQQDTNKYIEKFFEVQIPVPKLDSDKRRELFSQRLVAVLSRYDLKYENFSKSLDKIWEDGAGLYFANLRRIKLFLNRINHSLERIGSEINTEDFIRLELIRDIVPSLYELIYRNPEYFYRGDFAFETSFKGPSPLDKDEAKKERAGFYEKMKSSVPDDKHYAFGLLDSLFPDFALYRKVFGVEAVDATEAERTKRIFHPRCFRQYFLLKVPSELFSQQELNSFVASLRQTSEETAAESFSKIFKSIVKEDFKRWHFMHLVENRFEEFGLDVARGLCRGMARNSALWPLDAFELMIAVRSTRETLGKIPDGAARLKFLRCIVEESASDLYSLALLRRLEDQLKPDPADLAQHEQFRALGLPAPALSSTAKKNAMLLSEIEEIKGDLKKQLHKHYLIPDAPSVFEQFGNLGAGGIEPNVFLLSWRNLGADAESDQKRYIRDLFARRPEDLDKFLRLLFRADFIDDYSALKPLIDYKELSSLITKNESILDQDKVQQFKQRFAAEQLAAGEGTGVPA